MIKNDFVPLQIPDCYEIKSDGRIKKIGCKSPAISFPTKYTEKLASLVEALKVEGYWREDGYGAICNSNRSLIEYVQKLLENFGIHVTKSLILKVNVDLGIKSDEIRVFRGSKAKAFRIQNTQLRGTRVKRVVFSAQYEPTEYEIKVKGKTYRLSVSIHDDFFEVKCGLPTSSYINLRFRSLTFSSLLADTLKEKGGEKSGDIRLNRLLKKSPPRVVVGAFSTVVSCDGSVDHYEKYRRLRVRMKSKAYLEDWAKLLDSLGVNASIYKDDLYGLYIQNRVGFRKLVNYGFNLRHSVKKSKFQELLKSYDRFQVPRNEALNFYYRQLKEIGRSVTAKELASKAGKNKRTVSHYLKKLSEKDLINVEKGSIPYHYSA